MNAENSLDWEKLFPLNSDQVDEFLLLQEEACDIRNILQLKSTNEKDKFRFKDSSENEESSNKDFQPDGEEKLSEALEKFKLSKNSMLDTVSWTSNDLTKSLYEKIQQRLDTSALLSNQLSKASNILNDLEGQVKSLNLNAELLLSSTQRLFKEKDQVESIAKEIETHLSHFTFLEKLAFLIRQPIIQHPELFQILEQLHTCLTFMQKNRQFTDAALYETRYRQCLLRILNEFRNQLCSTFNEWSTSTDKKEVLQNETLINILLTLQTGLFMMQFKQECIRLKPYAQEIEKWLPDSEFDILRKESVNAYIQARFFLVTPFIQAVVKLEPSSDQLTWVTEFCSFVDTIVNEEISIFQLVFDSKYLADINSLLTSLSQPIVDRLLKVHFSDSIVDLTDFIRFSLARHRDDTSVENPLNKFIESHVEKLVNQSISICSNDSGWSPETFIKNMLSCRELVSDVVPFDFQIELLSLSLDTCMDMLEDQNGSNLLLFFQCFNSFREHLFHEIQSFEFADISKTNHYVDHVKQSLLEMDSLLIEIQEKIIKEYTTKCIGSLMQWMESSSSSFLFKSTKSVSSDDLLKAYETWFSEFSSLLKQALNELNLYPSISSALRTSLEKEYFKFYDWVHEIHSNSVFTNLLTKQEFSDMVNSKPHE